MIVFRKMQLLKDWELELLEVFQEWVKELVPENIKQVIIQDLEVENLKKVRIDNINTFTIKWQDWIWEVIVIIHFNRLSYRWTKRFLLWRKYVLSFILLMFSEERWDITKKIQKLLKKK